MTYHPKLSKCKGGDMLKLRKFNKILLLIVLYTFLRFYLKVCIGNFTVHTITNDETLLCIRTFYPIPQFILL